MLVGGGELFPAEALPGEFPEGAEGVEPDPVAGVVQSIEQAGDALAASRVNYLDPCRGGVERTVRLLLRQSSEEDLRRANVAKALLERSAPLNLLTSALNAFHSWLSIKPVPTNAFLVKGS